jgi:NhaP-type Na+/H+ or K+/H+ antiporter
MALSLALIILFGLAADYLFTRMRLPGLIGMLMVGILFGPHVFDLIKPELLSVSADFRMIALIVILLRAGLETKRDTLNRVGKTAITMSCIPAIFEGIAVMFAANMLLGISILEAAILGSIVAAVSPAVVVPLMVNFIERGRGAEKGIPTLILAASAIDDVFVIVIFSVLLGIYAGGTTSISLSLLQIPFSIILGILSGTIAGLIIYRVFVKYRPRATKKSLVLIGISIILVWFEGVLQSIVHISALIGIMTIGFIILEKSEPMAHIISKKLGKVWIFAEILLFVLVGAQVDINVAWEAGLTGALVILIGLIFRSIGTYISVMGTDLNFNEKMFCVVAYIPKATVQAAIGAVPLAAGVESGEIILAVAVLSIILTAPVGAIGIKLTGERVLKESIR